MDRRPGRGHRARAFDVPAFAFGLDGHEIIEATAYKRLLALAAVPGTGPPAISGRALLAALIATGVLVEPPCFDRARPDGDCGAAQRLDLPLRYWPTLGPGGPIWCSIASSASTGSASTSWRDTADGLTPVDPRFGVPGGLATAAYLRCVRVAGSVFDGILRDPRLAEWRIAGTYVLMHALEDSFSAAHVDRDPHFEIVHLLSWTLIDWPFYCLHGKWGFPASTHHGVSDARDADYLRWDARTRDGRACRDLHHPYAVPEECLTDRAKAAASTVVDFLVLTYRLRARASAEGRPASLFPPAPSSDAALWMAFVRARSAERGGGAGAAWSSAQMPLPRPDVFVGAQGVAGRAPLGRGALGARGSSWDRRRLSFSGSAAPPGSTAATASASWRATAQLSLLLPLVRRFTIGVAPAGLQLVCGTHFESCQADVVATLGELLVPLAYGGLAGGRGAALVVDRADDRSGLGGPLPRVVPRGAAPRLEPPSPAAGRDLGSARAPRRSGPFASPARPAPSSWRRPPGRAPTTCLRRRRARLALGSRSLESARRLRPGLQVEIDAGRIDSDARGRQPGRRADAAGLLLPNRLAVTATPALVRVGAFADRAVALDVAARAGVALEVGRLELEVDSPPLSYVSQARWHALPITVRLGLRFD